MNARPQNSLFIGFITIGDEDFIDLFLFFIRAVVAVVLLVVDAVVILVVVEEEEDDKEEVFACILGNNTANERSIGEGKYNVMASSNNSTPLPR